MAKHTLVRSALVLITFFATTLMADRPASQAAAQTSSKPDEQAKAKVFELFSASPAVFIENTGQIADSSIRYVFYGNGANIFHTTNGPVFQLFKRDKVTTDGNTDKFEIASSPDKRHRGPRNDGDMQRDELKDFNTTAYTFSANFVGAKNVKPTGAQGQQTKVNYYIGSDPNNWRKDVATFAEVVYPAVYDGIDLHTFGKRSHLKYEFHVATGADYSQILIRYEGIEGLTIDNEGRLHIGTPMGELVDDAPVIYQVINGQKVEIEGSYRLIDKKSYSFEITGQINPSAELVIDPDLAWASFLGGSGYDEGYGIAVDPAGNVFLTGYTQSTNFPVPGGFDTVYNGAGDVFVAKVTNSGQLAWASYLGGGGDDIGHGVAVDSSGNVFLTGYTYSSNFPVPGGFDTSYNANRDAFVAKVTNSGQLAWASYLGGSGSDVGHGVAADYSGDVFVTGGTESTNFPVPGGFDTSHNGGYDVFVAKVTNSGVLSWSSYLGGSGSDVGYGVAVDSSGNAFLTGWTYSSNFPTPGGFDTSYNGSGDVFVTKVTNSGVLSWSSYLGGSGSDVGYGAAVDSSGNVFLTGETRSPDFPVPGGFDTSYNGGGYDAFVAKVTNSGQLSWSSYLGGSDWDVGYGAAVDSSGNVFLTGETRSPDFPVPGGFDTSFNGTYDVFVAKVTNSGVLSWSSYLGGSGSDVGYGVAVDSSGNVFLTGRTYSTNFPVPGGFDTSYNGSSDAFVAKISDEGSGISGNIVGTVTDSNIGAPIANAEVLIAGMSNLSAKSDANGHYEIVGVPYNTLFTLVASAASYRTSYKNNVQVTEANPVQTVDINLIPSPWQSLELTELNPNPNSNPMKIMKGGIGHRYYQVVDENNIPRPRISVTTTPPLHGPFFSSAIPNGVVSIDVNSLEVTDGQSITVTHLNGTALEPAKQKSFVVSIMPLEQEKVWEIKAAGDLGVSNLTAEAEGAMEIRLSDEQGSDSNPEIIYVSRKALLGGGVSVSAKIGAGGQVGGFGANAGAGIEGSVTAGGIVRDMFGYAYNTGDISENAAKLDLLLYPTTLLSPQLVLIQSALDATLQSSYREELEAGVYIKGSGNAWGSLLLGSPKAGIGIGPHGYAEASVLSTSSFLWRKADEYAVAVEVGGDWKIQGGILVGGIELTKNTSTNIPVSGSLGGLSNVRFELIIDPNHALDPNLAIKKIKIVISNGKESGIIIGYDVIIDQTEWTIEGPQQSLAALLSPGGILDMLKISLNETPSQMVDLGTNSIVNEIDAVFATIQRQGNLTIKYERKLVAGRTIDAPVFKFDVGAAEGIEADISAGLEGSITESSELIIQKGRLVGLYPYPTESYSEDIYNPINITLADVYAKGLSDVGQPIIQSILNYGEQFAQTGQELILNAGNSLLHIGADILADGQRVVNVYGAQTQPKMAGMMGAMSDSNGLSEGFFGIGGSYRLEPADLNLPSPATFTISYSDSEVGGKDESLFRIYRWNDSNGTWEFVGGTVDIVNNTVTASIYRFGTYAIGSRVEYGNFKFSAEPNAAPSDGNNIVTFTSEIIKYNDGNQVANGTLFTVSVSGGAITTADANDSIDGNQILTESGILQFTLKAPQVGMKVKAEAVSLNWLALITGDVNFVDTNAPRPPTGLQAQIVDGKILLSWNDNNEIDLAGYEIYFDDDTSGAPYNGVAYYSGTNSPVDVADANSHFLRGLQSGHTYYITITAYDMSGNESNYSNEIVFVNTLPEDSDSDGMSDSWEIAYSNAANGLSPTANDAMLDNDGDGMTNLEEYLTDHNPLVPDVDGDFNHDRYVNIPDLAVFCAHWLDTGCSDPNWCDGTDIDHSNTVDFVDFAFFAKNWFYLTPAVLKQDFDHNGYVDFYDLNRLIGYWLSPCVGPIWCEGSDLDKNGLVNFVDFASFAAQWLEGI